MYTKNVHKLIATFGLLLCYTFIMPYTPLSLPIAKAGPTARDRTSEFRLNVSSCTLVTGESFSLRVYPVSKTAKTSYKSADSEIASVDEEGVVTANKVGTTSITVTIKDGTDSTCLDCVIKVGPPAFSVKITKSRIILGLDKVEALRVILKPSNTVEAASFSSYDRSIASVSDTGRITPNKVGMTYVFAQIDATDKEGIKKFAKCSVIVTDPDNTAVLEEYFSKHPELNLIPDEDMDKALDEFFNVSAGSTNSLVYSLHTFLDGKFNLVDLRKKWDAAITKVSRK